ncbi:hypothetical protein [Moraxella sp. Pampa]|uniref:hypothetical protein n=1 Tax=Moraxella sp. Pampa TaxID=3111978 RepID=UPI002B4073CE|nr:hypothetical protein [Moraxella sp. Pampa]
MPKVVSNPKTRSQIQAESDARRGVVRKSFTLQADDVAFIKESAQRLGLAQNELIVQAVRAFVKGQG